MFLNFLFLLILFPLSLLVYHCVPQRWQQPVLLGTSILFLVLWQAECSLLFFGLIAAGVGLLIYFPSLAPNASGSAAVAVSRCHLYRCPILSPSAA